MANDIHTWRVTYHDGTQIPEFDDERPDGRGFGEVEKHRVKTVELLGKHSVTIPDGAEPVFFRRRRVTVNPTDDTTVNHQAIHCIGWRRDDQEVYLFVFADGATLLSSDLQAV